MFGRSARRSLSIVITLAAAALVLAGCAKRPETELTSARTAVERARSSEAALYAPEALTLLEDSEKALLREAEAQDRKMFLTRNFDETARMAQEVSVKAGEVEKTVMENKAAARDEAARLIESTKTLILEVREMLATAPTGKGSALDLQVLREDLQSVEEALNLASNSFAEEKFLDAQKSAGLAMATGTAVKSDLTSAFQMKAKARPTGRKG